MIRTIIGVLLLVGALPAAVVAVAQAEPVSAMPAVPELDVVGSVRRMLEESRDQERVHPEEHSSVPEPAASKPEIAEEIEPHKAVSAPPVAVAPALPREATHRAPSAAGAPQRPSVDNSTHVPVPVKEITIRSLDDLRALSEELDRAKAEKARR